MPSKYATALLIILLLTLVTGSNVQAAPPLPASFYGIVILDSINTPNGTVVSAWIDGIQVAETSTFTADGNSVFSIDVLGDDPDTTTVEGSVEGDIIVFKVNDIPVTQTATWTFGSYTRLDLTATTPTTSPVAVFTAGKGINPAQLEDGATIAGFSSVLNNLISSRPENAIDADPSTIWRSASGQGTNQWIKVRLTGTMLHVVDRVVLRTTGGGDSVKDFQLRISTTGMADADFTTIFSGTTPEAVGAYEFTFAPAQARYVQLFVVTSHSGSLVTVPEFRVHTRDREGGIVSLLEGPPASVVAFSSQLDTALATNLIDENDSSAWQSAASQVINEWVKVKLGGSALAIIDRVQLQTGTTKSLRDFEIRISTTGTADNDFITVFSGTAANTTSVQSFSFSPTPARYVQLFVRNNYGSTTNISVRQLKVLTPDGANVARLEGVGAFIMGFSSAFSGSDPRFAIDFSTTNDWITANGQPNKQWMKIRLADGHAYHIDKVRLQGASGDGVKDFQVRVSTTGLADADFTAVLTGTLASDQNYHWFTFQPVVAKYVQLYIVNNYGAANYTRLRDFQVYASDLGDANVPFDNASTATDGALAAYQWHFGDGSTATEQHPRHLYSTPGDYPVTLTVTDTNGLAASTTLTYTVLTPPTADFSWLPAAPQETDSGTFSDGSTSPQGIIVARQWSFPSSFSVFSPRTQPLINVQFRDSGQLPVRLTVMDSQFRTATVTKTLTVLNLPPMVNAGSDQAVFWGETTRPAPTLSDPSNLDTLTLQCDWDFGDGQSTQVTNCTDTKATIPHVYTLPGVYNVTLTVRDKDGGVTSDSLVATVHKHQSYIHIESARITPNGEAPITIKLYDRYTGVLLPDKTITFATDSHTLTAATDSNGVATVTLPLLSTHSTTLTVTFAADDLYADASQSTLMVGGIDLVAAGLDDEALSMDTQTLSVNGPISVGVQNAGLDPSGVAFQVTLFEDRNHNGTLDTTDNVLGEQTVTDSIQPGQTITTPVPVSGALLFRDNLIYALVDSANAIDEADETNNSISTACHCIFQPLVGTKAFSPTLEWKWLDNVGPISERGPIITPIVAPLIDTNDDQTVDEKDVPALIFIASRYHLVAVRGDTGQEIFNIDTDLLNLRVEGQLAVGDIDDDGLPEIIAKGLVGGHPALAFNNDGTLKWRGPNLIHGDEGTIYGGPALADLDGDGTPEIIIGGTVLNANGTLRWKGEPDPRIGANSGLCCLSVVADIDLDDKPEIVGGNIVYRADGQVMWFNETDRNPFFNTPIADGYPAVANFDADPFAEIIVISDGTIRLHEHNGPLKWGPFMIDPDELGRCGAPTLADVDNDGLPEIGVACRDRYSVFEHDGTLKWWQPVQDGSRITGSSVFDFEGDGSTEIVYNDELYLRVFRGSDGTVLVKIPNSSGTLLENPVIADVDKDGNAEIVVVRNNQLGFGTQLGLTEFGVFVWGDANDNWVNTRSIWNQHTYHVTNVNDDGTIPAQEVNSWATHNTYRANLRLDGETFTAPDLTAAQIRLNASQFPTAVTLSARIGNGGANVVPVGAPVAFYNGNPATGGSRLGVMRTTVVLTPGEFEDVIFTWLAPPAGTHDIYIVADDDGTSRGIHNECRETNNQHHTQVSVGVAPELHVAKTDNQAIVQLNQVLTYTLTVSNQSAIEAESVVITDILPAHVTFVAASAGGIKAGNEVVWPAFTVRGNSISTRTVTVRIVAQLTAGTYSITNTVVAKDGTGAVASAQDVDRLEVRNGPPVAQDDMTSTNEKTAVIIDVLANDSDGDRDLLTITAIGTPSKGVAAITNDATIIYTPTANISGTDVFTYTVSDGSLTATARITVTIRAINEAPAANDDTTNTNEDTAVVVDVLANDVDPDGDALTIVTVGQANNGLVTTAGNEVTYTPVLNFTGSDVFTYTVSDGSLKAIARVTVTVNPVNDAPVAADDAASTAENTPVVVLVLANDQDPEGNPLTVSTLGAATHGSLVTDGTTVTYTPGPNFSGTDHFTYTISDGSLTDTAVVTIIVTAVNDPPVANDDALSTPEDTPVTVAVLANDNDPDGDPLLVIAVGAAEHGEVALDNGTVIYTPAPNFTGSAVFTYTVSDASYTATAQVTVTISPVNDPPLAQDDVTNTAEDTAVTVDVLANDSDPEGDVLTVVAVGTSGAGTVTAAGNMLTYTPAANVNGATVFTYTITDGSLIATAQVVINVTAVGDPPTANDDETTTVEDSPVTIAVLTNDRDPDGDLLTVITTEPPTNGTVTIVGATVLYTPNPDYNGSDSFIYTASDGELVASAKVMVNVTPVNDPPFALDDVADTNENMPVTILVLANDSDVDGDVLTITAVGSAAQGTVTTDGIAVTYTPATDFTGADSFTYTVADGASNTTGHVTINVRTSNASPIANDDTASTDEDTPVTIAALSNDSDPDSDRLVIMAVGAATHGHVTTDGTQLFYTPAPNFNGSDSFTYTISDGSLTVQATVAVTVNLVNDAPNAADDGVSTPEDTSITIDVLSNDDDPERDTLTIVAVTVAGNGNTTTDGAVITYAPAPDFYGADSFAYTISDGDKQTTARVQVNVTPANDGPVAQADVTSTAEDTPVTVDVLANDRDIDGDGLAVVAVDVAQHGVVTTDGHTITYLPSQNYHGVDQFTYTVSDGQLTATVQVTIDVMAVNDAPIANPDGVSTPQNTPVTVAVLVNDADPDGDVLRVLSVAQSTNGVATINPDKTVTFTPAPGFTGTGSFIYTVSDGQGGTATATVTIEVTPATTCALYPIALHETTLANAAVGQLIPNILNGQNAGNFGWLSWTGQNSVPSLVTSLTPPGNSDTYINPNNANDHQVSVGDWVRGLPGVNNAKAVRDALDRLKTIDIVLPVWNQTTGQGANLKYRVSSFALVRITDYRLPSKQSISVRFLGSVTCGGIAATVTAAERVTEGGDDNDDEATEEHHIFLPLITQ